MRTARMAEKSYDLEGDSPVQTSTQLDATVWSYRRGEPYPVPYWSSSAADEPRRPVCHWKVRRRPAHRVSWPCSVPRPGAPGWWRCSVAAGYRTANLARMARDDAARRNRFPQKARGLAPGWADAAEERSAASGPKPTKGRPNTSSDFSIAVGQQRVQAPW